MELTQWLEHLREIVRLDKKHPDYARVVELANKYKALITGEGLDVYMRQFARREDAALFAQRKAITQHITPSICENITKPFYKVTRSNRVYQTLTSDSKETVEGISTALKQFYGEGEQSGLDYYMQTRFVELSFQDPNAFLAVEFDAFDPVKEKAKPKPVEILSENAVNFQYKNGTLEMLLGCWPHQYKSGIKSVEGKRYVMYVQDFAIELRQVDKDKPETDLPENSFEWFEIGKKGESGYQLYTMQQFEPKSGQVPAMRVGYKRDIFTGGRSYVSPLHPALPYLMKSLKAVSELDLTAAFHAFPQKLQYVEPCPGVQGKNCVNGKTREGGVCTRCKGTGSDPVATTAQEIILVPRPKDKEQMVDLEKLVVYKSPAIDLIKWQDEYVDKLTEKAIRAIFNGSQFTKPTVEKTATEVDDTADAQNDTLAPFAKRFSSSWMQIVRLVAIYTENNEGLTIFHKFPSDFKLKSQGALLVELQAANNSGAPAYVLDSINEDILEIMYADDRDTLEKVKVKQRHLPFKGKTADQITQILASSLTSNNNKVLYANFEEIWDALEEKYGDKIYLMETSKQRQAIREQVELINAEVSKAQAKALAQFAPPPQPIA